MFGLSQLQERLISLGVMAVAAVCVFFYIEHLGAQKCEKAVEKANVVEEKKEAKQYTADVTTVQTEGKTYEATTSAPLSKPAPAIRLCPPLRGKAVPPAAPAEPEAHAEAPSGAGDSGPATVWDTTPLVKVGRDADAQIAGLQDYITKVCRPGP